MGERGKASQWRMCAWQHNPRKGVEMSHPYTLFVHSSVVLTSVSPATTQDHEDCTCLAQGSRLRAVKNMYTSNYAFWHTISISHLIYVLVSRKIRWYVFTPLRDVSTRLITDNIFQIETAAIAQRVCRTQDGGVLRIDSACTYPCVHHRCTCFVLLRADIPEFLQQFLQRIHARGSVEVSARVAAYDRVAQQVASFSLWRPTLFSVDSLTWSCRETALSLLSCTPQRVPTLTILLWYLARFAPSCRELFLHVEPSTKWQAWTSIIRSGIGFNAALKRVIAFTNGWLKIALRFARWRCPTSLKIWILARKVLHTGGRRRVTIFVGWLQQLPRRPKA